MPLSVTLTPGTTLYKYQLLSRIGGGGFGDVWLARDHSIGRDVAVKVLDSTSAAVNERLVEAQIGNQLNHPNLVKVHYADVVPYGGTQLVLIAMDYLAAGSIIGRVNAGNFIPLRDGVRYVIDVLRGLEYLHEQRLFHGDIKPKNILMGASGEAVLTDYGISCRSPGLTPVAARDAYLLHLAPEVLTTRNTSIQADIYQVGMTGFRILNGVGTVEDKFNAVGQAAFLDLVTQGKVIEAGDYRAFIPRNLKTILNRAINVTPGARYQSALEMRRALEGLAYPGDWTCNARGELIGVGDGYSYRFEELARPGGVFDLSAFKTKLSSNRETRIAAYSGKRLSRSDADAKLREFIQFVVTGNP